MTRIPFRVCKFCFNELGRIDFFYRIVFWSIFVLVKHLIAKQRENTSPNKGDTSLNKENARILRGRVVIIRRREERG